jgi:hypothetical protein
MNTYNEERVKLSERSVFRSSCIDMWGRRPFASDFILAVPVYNLMSKLVPHPQLLVAPGIPVILN